MSVSPINSAIPLAKDVAHIPQEDPRWIYKAGEQPRLMHNIDAPGWVANGWSHDKPQEVVAEPVTEPPPAVVEKETPRKPRKPAIDASLTIGL